MSFTLQIEQHCKKSSPHDQNGTFVKNKKQLQKHIHRFVLKRLPFWNNPSEKNTSIVSVISLALHDLL